MSSQAPPYSPGNMATPDSGGLEVVQHGNDLPQVVDGFKMKPMESGYGASAGVAEEKKILGLRRTTFIMAVVMVLIVIAAAVGGGIGGSKAVSSAYDRGFGAARAELAFEPPEETSNPDSDDADNADDTEEETPTQSGRMDLPDVRGKLPLDCPNLNDGTHDVAPRKKAYRFRATCGADSGPGEGDRNIMTLTAYRFADCMRACASLNDRGNVGDGNVCGAVRFHMDLAFVGSHGGNCWLKKGVDTMVLDKNDDTKNNHIIAELIN